ncbi:MAG: transglutaminase domain-containing protein [Chloroflexi bacterium]|nr:transglutaminase domain-containing protein [Chloroflexota bacterium]
MAFDRQRYLQPSGLCDFDRSAEIRLKTRELTAGCRNRAGKFSSLFAFVKELPYGLEDWDLKASDILRKGWGMCSGKTNLLVAMLRSAGIPARYRVYRIKADSKLWDKLGKGNDSAARMNGLGEERDHVDCEAWLGKWVACDAGRDTAMEKGIVRLGGTLERQVVAGSSGRARYLRLASLDQWAKERQDRRVFRSDRDDVFAGANQGIEKIRQLGRAT